jgi:hypothetical protein
MPRKKPDQLKSAAPTTTPAPTPAAAPAPAPVAPVIQQSAPTPQPVGDFHPADTNGDGHVSSAEEKMYLEFKRRELEDADAMRDAQRKMAWFSLAGMLLYPFAVVLAVLLNLDQAATVLGSMASVYFVSVAAIVAAFFGAQAVGKSSSSKKR